MIEHLPDEATAAAAAAAALGVMRPRLAVFSTPKKTLYRPARRRCARKATTSRRGATTPAQFEAWAAKAISVAAGGGAAYRVTHFSVGAPWGMSWDRAEAVGGASQFAVFREAAAPAGCRRLRWRLGRSSSGR